MKNIRRISVTLLTLLISFVFVPVAFAHPLGNFTINHYAGLHVTRTSIDIDFVLDLAEIPAFQEIATFDTNGNGQPDSAEAEGYHADKCRALQPDLNLLLNNKPVGLILGASSVTFPSGAGGLPTLRLTCEFRALIPDGMQLTNLTFLDNSYSERIGWREIVVSADGVRLNGDFATTSVSNRLTAYPKDLLANPLNQHEVTVGIDSVVAPQAAKSVNAQQSIPSLAGSRSDAFTQLITLENLTVPTILFALLISFVWGAMHAMTPGHGKTIVGAYLVGSRGTVKHAVYLGLTTTITHTLGVFILGLLTLFAAKFIVPEKLFPWISLLSGLFVVGIGINLFVSRFKTADLGNWFGNLKASLTKLPKYALITAEDNNLRKFSSVSDTHRYIIASTGQRHHSLYFEVDEHTHEDHDHPHAHPHDHHDHRHAAHDHDHADHSHTPPETITWRNLLALGVSGGLLPCPSALVVLLGAIALNRIGFGLVLVLAFSLGLAGTLTAIGMAFIYAGRLFNRFPVQGKILKLLPAVSALIVSIIGVGITVKALIEIRIV